MAAYRILLVDDHALIRRSLSRLLDSNPRFSVIGEAGNGEEAYQKALTLHPDLVLMDVKMPGLGGVEAVRLIRKALPAATIVMLTVSEEDADLFGAVREGAMGYLLKDIEPEALFAGLEQVMSGEPVFSRHLAGRILRQFAHLSRKSREVEPADRSLTEREVEVLRLAAQGLTNAEIAQRLSLSENTVKKHLSRILSKLQVSNRVQAAKIALRRHLLEESDE